MKNTEKSVYVPMFQSNTTNNLTNISQKLINRFLADGKGDGELPIAWKREDDVLYWIVPRKVNLYGRTHQMFDYIVQKYTSKVPANASQEIINKNKELTLDLHEISVLFDVTMQATREIVIKAIKSLQNIKIEQLNIAVKDHQSKPIEATIWTSVILQSIGSTIGAKSIKNCKVKVLLGDKLAEYLPTAPILPYSLALFSINPSKYPNAYALGKRLNLLYKMNRNKNRRNIVAVTELLDVAPDIPRKDDVIKIGGLRQRIITPFIRDMKVLVTRGVIKEWYFVDKVTKEPYSVDFSKLTYNKFEALNVYFDFKDFPINEVNHIKHSKDNEKEIVLMDSSGNKVKLFVNKN